MKEELLTLVDSKDKIIGTVFRSAVAENAALIYRGVRIILLNKQRLVLLAMRSLDKDVAPGKWDVAAAGHVRAQETPLQAAIRETREELGITVKLKYLGKKFLDSHGQSRFDWFYYATIGDEEFTLNTNEVAALQWVTTKDIPEFARTNKFNLQGSGWEMIQKLQQKLSKTKRDKKS